MNQIRLSSSIEISLVCSASGELVRERKLKQLATETVNLLCCCAEYTDVRDVHLWALIGKSWALAQCQDWRNS